MAADDAASGVPNVGSHIALISKSLIRYTGVLYTINMADSTIALQNGAPPAPCRPCARPPQHATRTIEAQCKRCCALQSSRMAQRTGKRRSTSLPRPRPTTTSCSEVRCRWFAAPLAPPRDHRAHLPAPLYALPKSWHSAAGSDIQELTVTQHAPPPQPAPAPGWSGAPTYPPQVRMPYSSKSCGGCLLSAQRLRMLVWHLAFAVSSPWSLHRMLVLPQGHPKLKYLASE